jgi:hypothetical protein
MTRLSWALFALALTLWTAVLWATAPTGCGVPDQHHIVRCDP